jgi:hypothetical protein
MLEGKARWLTYQPVGPSTSEFPLLLAIKNSVNVKMAPILIGGFDHVQLHPD